MIDIKQFFIEHQGHSLCPADDPAQKTKGVLCCDCDELGEVSLAEWNAQPVLQAWGEERRQEAQRQQKERQIIQELLRQQNDSALPEVRFTARYGRRDEE